MIIKKQQGPNWTDESGMAIPVNRVTKSEKLREHKAYMLARDAVAISKRLIEYKQFVQDTCAEVVDAIREENGIKPDSKGNITWYNFDRSIKIEVNVNEVIKFDEVLIDAAKKILMDMIATGIQGDEFIKGLVTDAFQTSKGSLDTRRVLSLQRHTSRVPAALKAQWEQAMGLINKSISRPSSKVYQRIWVRNGTGEYDLVDLNFSSIKGN